MTTVQSVYKDGVADKSRINWLAVLRGYSTLLVVIAHVGLTDVYLDPATPLTTAFIKVKIVFNMPLFMFISGFLLYYTKVRKQVGYGAVFVDRMKRLLIPYAFFTVITFGMKFMMGNLMKRQVALSGTDIFRYFFVRDYNPLLELWFIPTLFVITLLYPVFVYSLKKKEYAVGMLLVCLLVHLYPGSIRLFYLSSAGFYLFYFYLGIVVCRYELYAWLMNNGALLLSGCLFALVNVFFSVLPEFVQAVSGIVFSFCICWKLSCYFPALFGSFRSYPYQIYLMGFYFQMSLRYVYIKYPTDYMYVFLFVVSVLLALYIPVLITQGLEKVGNRFILALIGIEKRN